jgi:RNA methyltransferase, TrmH family
MHRTITGFSNPTVKFLRSLRDKKHRRREKRFLAEGLRLLTDARECGTLPETLVMATDRAPHPLLDGLAADVAAAGGEVIEMHYPRQGHWQGQSPGGRRRFRGIRHAPCEP